MKKASDNLKYGELDFGSEIGILAFDLTDAEAALSFKRHSKCLEMAIALFNISEICHHKIKYADNETLTIDEVEDILTEISDIASEYCDLIQ